MRTQTRRLIVATLVLFVAMVGLDYLYIRDMSVGVNTLLLAPATILFFAFVPFAFWWATAPGGRSGVARLLVVVASAVAFLLIAYVPFMWAHFAMGGRH